MADASKITVNGETYDVKDPTARNAASAALTAASAAQTTADGKLSDAPSDGLEYVRKNGGWVEPAGGGSGLPDGGTIGQVLAKNSDTDGDAGWYNLRHLPSDKWYLPDGILESDVIAAYQFVNRLDEAEALININDGAEYPLSKSASTIIWSGEQGITIPAVSNVALSNNMLVTNYANVVTAVFGFNGVNIPSVGNGRCIGGIQLGKARRLTIGCYGGNIDNATASYSAPSINQGDGTATDGAHKYHNQWFDHGVLGGEWVGGVPSMFVNGISRSLAKAPGYCHMRIDSSFITIGLLVQPKPQYISNNPIYSYCATALVLYNTTLTAAQHLQLSDNIHALGGID